MWHSLFLAVLNVWYSNAGGSENPFWRNVINACGFTLYNSAALDIMGRRLLTWSTSVEIQWLLITAGIVLTTIQIQDLRDQEGDQMRGRPTLPLIIGDKICRITIVASVISWSLFAMWFWQYSLIGCGVTAALSVALIWWLSAKRTIAGDRESFKIWSLWLILIYALPWIQSAIG